MEAAEKYCARESNNNKTLRFCVGIKLFFDYPK